MKTEITITDENRCKTNTARARRWENGGHYDLQKLAEVTQLPSMELLLKDLDFFAENGDDDGAVKKIASFASGLLNLYVLQKDTYK